MSDILSPNRFHARSYARTIHQYSCRSVGGFATVQTRCDTRRIGDINLLKDSSDCVGCGTSFRLIHIEN